jgi:hypothetical protein
LSGYLNDPLFKNPIIFWVLSGTEKEKVNLLFIKILSSLYVVARENSAGFLHRKKLLLGGFMQLEC